MVTYHSVNVRLHWQDADTKQAVEETGQRTYADGDKRSRHCAAWLRNRCSADSNDDIKEVSGWMA